VTVLLDQTYVANTKYKIQKQTRAIALRHIGEPVKVAARKVNRRTPCIPFFHSRALILAKATAAVKPAKSCANGLKHRVKTIYSLVISLSSVCIPRRKVLSDDRGRLIERWGSQKHFCPGTKPLAVYLAALCRREVALVTNIVPRILGS
jgi:hypothetical protein